MRYVMIWYVCFKFMNKYYIDNKYKNEKKKFIYTYDESLKISINLFGQTLYRI